MSGNNYIAIVLVIIILLFIVMSMGPLFTVFWKLGDVGSMPRMRFW
ncbi:hypothetical protein BH23ACT11_BH23ACT11_17350 [soil metagenome]